jgi:hypothetical protein
MIQRGRKSAGSLAIVSQGDIAQLPPPPSCLTDEEGLIWRAVMASPIAAMIRPEAWPLAEEYCRLVVTGRRLALAIENLDADASIGDWDKLLAMQNRNQRALTSIAVKLRLTPSAVQNGDRKGAILLRKEGKRPWEDPA